MFEINCIIVSSTLFMAPYEVCFRHSCIATREMEMLLLFIQLNSAYFVYLNNRH